MQSCCLRPDRAGAGLVAGFTLLEALATLVVILLALAALAQYLTSVQRAWQAAAADPFADAASAFETVAQNLAWATLEPYQDYADAGGAFRGPGGAAFVPDHLARRSDLAFVGGPSAGAGGLLAATGRTTATTSVFFNVPAGQTQLDAQAGLDRLLNARGYFVEFGGDSSAPGFFTGAPRLRWRLKEIAQPSEALQVYASTTSAPWVAQLAGSSATPSILAENVIALVVLPERAASDPGAPIAPAYAYDSRDGTNPLTLAQLPPRVRVVLAAIDEASAQRLAAQDGASAPALVAPTLFQDATKLDSDVASLDASLTAARIGHRIFQRDEPLVGSAWSGTP
jgi:uncharacterized protein (TIGR02599 family)